MRAFHTLVFAALLALALALSAVSAFSDDLMMFDAGANPSLCTCECECQRPKGSELLKSHGGSEMTSHAVPVKINNVV